MEPNFSNNFEIECEDLNVMWMKQYRNHTASKCVQHSLIVMVNRIACVQKLVHKCHLAFFNTQTSTRVHIIFNIHINYLWFNTLHLLYTFLLSRYHQHIHTHTQTPATFHIATIYQISNIQNWLNRKTQPSDAHTHTHSHTHAHQL